jgi:molybdopterin synthase sulfur carrier subunit
VATVFIPTQLRRLTGGRDRLDVAAASVGELVDAIERSFPGFRDRVVAGDDVAPGLSVAVDGETAAAGLLEPVGPTSEVHFIPALGGG